MAAAASFSVSHENDNTNRLADPETYRPIYTRFRGNSEKKVVKTISCQAAAILIIGGKLIF